MEKLHDEVHAFLQEKYGMTSLDDYQREASTTAVYPSQHKILYPALGLAGEAGEVANKVKKLIRDGPDRRPSEWRQDIASELGDVLWYCAALANDLGLSLSIIAVQNLDKLRLRKEADTIQGSGDTR
jgi:NTP pyrophosphatase (non-canonical NTP hydrolase)